MAVAGGASPVSTPAYGFERISKVPRQILALSEAAHVPAIWATQMLETLATTGQPSRAEVTDAAARQRAECVMLNKGPHVADAIRALDDILGRMGEVQRKSQTLMRRVHSGTANRQPGRPDAHRRRDAPLRRRRDHASHHADAADSAGRWASDAARRLTIHLRSSSAPNTMKG